MANENEIEFGPVELITADAIGKPGERTFFIQAAQGEKVLTFLVEKIQLQTLAIGVEQFLSEIATRFPDLEEASGEYNEEKMHILPPVDPLFRVGDLGLSYEAGKDLLVLIVREVAQEPSDQDADDEGSSDKEEPPGSQVIHVLSTRSQLLAMCRWALEVASRGRPLCPQCGEPMDPEGHFCPKKNGHKH